ncbi:MULTISPECIES: aliphatic sulfonate ABC transporter substrate-binding protein [Variovorax]|jgi:sulfonate transport system substrate-binding protein|uniref:aliphatic sulfonate ABC transporter substrate-binding protein n=1 Tax=Variovorax TaxID=34072 RepID=UPI00086D8618|nr:MULTISPECIES: aliphatic sulfonate ABC transporter substrate-binding protein [Variovorax]MBN8754774.1 aliphatic sulfonate ABC transporter substrate-binding protein [Variovorax sp.]ODU11831.1 MAG: aliphatic sulfonate ABC transporter substrate-binding protein [Variovorax sp. SCN 67-85]ODV14807.1 MAG: aliphatic sulfonate ABC transporter substrate-binding protein [Variovorax sp. SCN 67-20]OJZ05478.1 MAG: aliphatic sulfonate ABC transporter substrate-binding protein [Variovorax sp. 67-131]UKI0507
MTTHSSSISRRTAIATLAALGSGAVLAQGAGSRPVTVRLGYQKSSTLIAVLKAQGVLEKQLAPLNATLSWHEFTSGLPLLEALNLDNLDISADVADTVPVFAQAAGADLTFIAQEAPSPAAQAIVVREDSPIKTVADLKGKKVGFAKAAGAHYLLIAALDKAGLSFRDIEPAYLTPADGRAAFEKGAIDAWVVWDPFLAAAQRQSKVRVLADGAGIASYQRYYLASTKFAKARPDVLRVVYAELEKTGKWVKQNPKDAATLLAPVWGLDAATIEQANGRRSYAVRPVVAEGLTEQQRIADAFFAEKLLPRKIDALNVALFKPGA